MGPVLEVAGILGQTTYSALRPWRDVAMKDRVSVYDSVSTAWYNYCTPDLFIGFGALVRIGAYKFRLRALYVFPNLRGQGHGTMMTQALIAVAQHQGAEVLEAVAWHPKWYLDRGWTAVRGYKNQGTLVRRELASTV